MMLAEFEVAPPLPQDPFDWLWVLNIVLLLGQVASGYYAWRQLKGPYRFPLWRWGWRSMLAMIGTMVIHSVYTLWYPPTWEKLWWNPWIIHVDNLLVPAFITVALLLTQVSFAGIFQRPLTMLSRDHEPPRITIDRHSRVLAWNHEAEQLFGYPATEAVDQLLTELIMPERYHADHLQAIETLLAGEWRPLIGSERIFLIMGYRRGLKNQEFPLEITVTIEADETGEAIFTGKVRRLFVW